MKKVGINMLSVLLLTGGIVYAQQKNEYKSLTENGQQLQENVLPFTSKQAMVGDSLKAVFFGAGRTFADKRVLKVDIEPIKFQGRNYYFNHGDFYIYNGGRYLLVAPPTGLKVKNLLQENPNLEQVTNTDYFGKGVFFNKTTNNEFETVSPPKSAIIYTLPALTDVVTIDDAAYYEYLGVLYEKVFVNGEQGFKVVGELWNEYHNTEAMDRKLKNLLVSSMHEIIEEVQEMPDPKTLVTFRTKYPQANYATWIHIEHGVWRVDFDWKKKAYYALFDINGDWLESRNKVLWDFIPSQVKQPFKSDHPEKDIHSICHIKSDNGDLYEFIYQKEGQKHQLLYDTNGRMLASKIL